MSKLRKVISGAIAGMSPDEDIPSDWPGQVTFNRMFADVADAQRALHMLTRSGDEVAIHGARRALSEALAALVDEVERRRSGQRPLENS